MTNIGEVLVEWELRRAGHVILGRNVRAGHLEVDIVSKHNWIVWLWEVRLRTLRPGDLTYTGEEVPARKRLALARWHTILPQLRAKLAISDSTKIRFALALVYRIEKNPRLYILDSFLLEF